MTSVVEKALIGPDPNIQPGKHADANGITYRMVEVALLIAQGHTAHSIARRLGVATSTVRTHMHHALKATDTHTHTALITWLFRRGYLDEMKMERYTVPNFMIVEAFVLRYLVLGWRNAAIGERLTISESSVASTVLRLRTKFQAKNRAHLAALAWQLDLPLEVWWAEEDLPPGQVRWEDIIHIPIINKWTPKNITVVSAPRQVHGQTM